MNYLDEALKHNIDLNKAIKISLEGYATYLNSLEISAITTNDSYLQFFYNKHIGNITFFCVENKAKIFITYNGFVKSSEITLSINRIDNTSYFKSIYNIINTLFEAIKKNVESSYNEGYILFDNTFFKEFIE